MAKLIKRDWQWRRIWRHIREAHNSFFDHQGSARMGVTGCLHHRFTSVFPVSGLGWQWALCFLAIAYVVISVAVMLFAKWHKSRFERLPPPRPETARNVYKEHAHAVGHMRGIK
ncbi:MAG: hypothetical protein RB191_10940 [Terriglobia bacterium]|nr:hypothetical protein [Terriglobia bacterium]